MCLGVNYHMALPQMCLGVNYHMALPQMCLGVNYHMALPQMCLGVIWLFLFCRVPHYCVWPGLHCCQEMDERHGGRLLSLSPYGCCVAAFEESVQHSIVGLG